MKILKINDLIQNLAEYPRTTSIQSLKVSFNSFTVMPQLNALFFEKNSTILFKKFAVTG